ncbi:phosphatidylinositide phosphatase SAC2-like [Liolophura sinensis]|uniref:phosphatidylinositide phosphatase SAC2-like n=1 Tax=Liolophura sinensis TaxID=3198878 RepID=UPI0031581B31
MEEQLTLYKNLSVVSLSELSGKEQVIGEAFLTHILNYNSPNVTFIAFDFHDYCRGMKFENVSILTEVIRDVIKGMRYCWVDNQGMICEQKGIFRINCIDCLDRTNVVQSAIARIVMETQCRKLGLLPPDEELPPSCRQLYQQLWANNGDVISQQYAGTVALKGDYTRTGERKFSGMMKDGMNSANRYYLRFRDTYHQAVIDLMLGQPISEEALLSGNKLSPEALEETTDLLEKEENVRQLIEDCKNMLIVEPEECLGGWGLVDADPVTGDPDRQELDVILLLSQRSIYVAWYDDDKEEFTKYQRIFLEDIEKIEIGPEPSLFKSKYMLLRIHYHNYAEEGYFHSFRTPSTRFFNNTVITISNTEEAKESLRSICQSFTGALKIFALDLEVVERQKLDRKKSRPHPDVTDIHKKLQETSLVAVKMPRDNSSTDLQQLLRQRQQTREKQSPSNKSPAGSQKISPVSPTSHQPGSSRLQQAFSIVNKNYNRVMPHIKMPVPKMNLNLKKLNPLDIKIPVRMSVPKMTLKSLNPLQMIKQGEKKMAESSDRDATDIPVVPEGVAQDVEASPGMLTREYSQDDSSLVGTREVDLIDAVASGKLELDQETDDEVMLHSCGILATTHGQLLATSLSLSSPDEPEGTIKLTNSENKRSSAPPNTVFNSSASVSSYVSEKPTDTLPCPTIGRNPLGSKSDSQIILQDKKGDGRSDSQQTVSIRQSASGAELTLSGETSDISKCDKLHHPSMKASLSEGALSQSQVKVPSIADETDTVSKERMGPLSKLRSFRLPNINLPTLPNSSNVPNKVRRKLRGPESLNQLIEAKAKEGKCNTKIIII